MALTPEIPGEVTDATVTAGEEGMTEDCKLAEPRHCLVCVLYCRCVFAVCR